MTPQALIPSPFNQVLAQKHQLLKDAIRFAIGTECTPGGTPVAPVVKARTTLKTIPFDITVMGDNIVIPGLAGVKQIYEFVFWNVTAQDVVIQQGQSGTVNYVPLLVLPGFPSTSGLILGFNGNFDQAHWDIDNNQPLVISLANGTRATGFIRYRIANGLVV